MTENRPDPLRHDSVTTPCPACGTPFVPVGRQQWCSPNCRALGYRRRKTAATPPVTLATPSPRRPHTIYECQNCSTRSLGQQRCEECGTFMRKIGIGGECPNCYEPLAITDLVGPDLAQLT
jgi:predicted nucleic acid-binding Zn ribbon protein